MRIQIPRMSFYKTCTIGLMVSILAIQAKAAFVFESEANGTATNNTLAGAESIGPLSFTMNVDPNVFGSFPTASVSGLGGGMDVDFFSFSAGAGTAYFDIDNAPSTFDTYVALFDGNGTILGDSDDSFPADAGSDSDTDSFLGEITLTSAGIYYVAVSRYPNFANATFTGTDFEELVRPDGEFGGFAFLNADFGDSSFDMSGPQTGSPYTLHITIPEPGTVMLTTMAFLSLPWLRRRSANLEV